MPTYGEAKRRDIIESVLPSTSRRMARESLAAVKRHNRRAIRQAYQKYRWDDPDDVEFDFNQTCDREVREIMWTRRDGDKLGTLRRWAPKATKDIRPMDRESWLFSVFPDNTIGRHAAGHAKDYVDDDDPYSWKNWKETRAAREKAARAEMVAVIMEHMEFGGFHTRFNLALKGASHRIAAEGVYRWRTQCPTTCEHVVPLLLGIHDIEDFVDRLWGIRIHHPGWWNTARHALGLAGFSD